MNASKYNKSEILRNAWVIFRASSVSFSQALKTSWNKAKISYTVNANGSIVSEKSLVAVFELSFSQTKEREWVKKAGARWNAENKTWILTTSACQIGASANYGLHVIPSHIVSLIKSIA